MPASSKRNRLPIAGVGLAAVVTPMLDMTFQLLFFFILNFKPLSQEGQVELSLLAADDKGRTAADQPIDAGLGEADSYTIHVNSIIPFGRDKPVVVDVENIAFVRLTSKLESVSLSGIDALETKLRSLPKFEGRGQKAPSIKLQVNNRLKYSQVIALLDLCRRVGKDLNISDIGVMSYPK